MKKFTHLEIETQGDCNRTCGTCLRQTYIDKDNGTHQGRFPVTSKEGRGIKMPTTTFERIIDEAIEYGFVGAVCLQHYNEPLLDERIVELAKYVKSKNTGDRFPVTQLSMCTNMDLITEELAKELDGVMDQLEVALYMPLEKQEAREKYILSLFPNTKVDFTKGVHYITHYSTFTNTADAVTEAILNPCHMNRNALMFAYNGTVLHCCDDYVGHFGLGNINTSSVKDLWESEAHKELLAKLSLPGGRLNYNYCSTCPRS
jgi:radical SAM protein with 4Fe4S-binding SPASM domain